MEKIKTLFTKENIVKSLKWFFFSYIWLAVLMFIIDIVSKTIVKVNMTEGQSIDLIPNFLHITYIHNNGMAFGIDFENQLANTIVFISVSIIGAGLIGFCTWRYWKKLGQVGKASVMLMLSGTIGNLIDRAFYVEPSGDHFVVDFIHFEFFGWSFPCFNIADSCLVVGVIMLLIYMLVVDYKQEKAKKAEKVLKTQGNVNDSNLPSEEKIKEDKSLADVNSNEEPVKEEKEKDEPRND